MIATIALFPSLKFSDDSKAGVVYEDYPFTVDSMSIIGIGVCRGLSNQSSPNKEVSREEIGRVMSMAMTEHVDILMP